MLINSLYVIVCLSSCRVGFLPLSQGDCLGNLGFKERTSPAHGFLGLSHSLACKSVHFRSFKSPSLYDGRLDTKRVSLSTGLTPKGKGCVNFVVNEVTPVRFVSGRGREDERPW